MDFENVRISESETYKAFLHKQLKETLWEMYPNAKSIRVTTNPEDTSKCLIDIEVDEEPTGLSS